MNKNDTIKGTFFCGGMSVIENDSLRVRTFLWVKTEYYEFMFF